MIDVLNNEGYCVLDNLFTQEEQDYTESYFLHQSFPWHFSENIFTCNNKFIDAYKTYHPLLEEFLQLQHTFYNIDLKDKSVVKTSMDTSMVDKILDRILKHTKLDAEVIRCKINLQPKNADAKENSYNTPHKDFDFKHFVILYYVNDSDGDTVFFNKDGLSIQQRIVPKKGRVLIFDGDKLHTGSHPRRALFRLIINFDMRLKEAPDE